jgi:uncharacterized membrane protein (UPF0127 family)
VSRRAIAFTALLAALAAAGPRAEPWSGSAVAIFPSGAEFGLEIADEPAEWVRGYMERDRVPSDEGMLFVYPVADHHGFWMKNCLVPLDMIWLDDEFRVIEVLHDRQPCPREGPCPTVGPMRAARYVLEIAAGRAREEALRAGDLVVVRAEPPLP